MSDAERDRLRERVASGTATGEERDRLAGVLARAIRECSDHELQAIDAMVDELRLLADAGSDRSSCTDALAGALLDAQIRAFERRDAADAWSRLDEIRARLLQGGTPDLLHDRFAAALFNTYRGGELLGDEPMRLAALEELWTRAYRDPSAAASRVALAELLADAIGVACRRLELERAEQAYAELERLRERDQGLAIARELGRATRELLAFQIGSRGGEQEALLTKLCQLVASFELSPGDLLEQRLAEALVLVHAEALRDDDELRAEALREQLRLLADRAAEQRPDRAEPLLRELGKALHDAAVLGAVVLGARALAELRVLVDHHEADAELRAQLMSALFQVHRNAIERGDIKSAERLQAEADTLLARDEALETGAVPESVADLGPTPQPSSKPSSNWGETQSLERSPVSPPAAVLRSPSRSGDRSERARAELRLDHLRILLATHANAGDRGDWIRAELLLARARNLVDRAGAPLGMLEVFGQMLVNAQVDAGFSGGRSPSEERPSADALLLELRELAKGNPYSGALQLHLATALFNAHVDAGRRGSTTQAERLLDELDQLHRSHPGLLELRRRLLMALVNHHGEALDHADFVRASELLEQVRELVRSPDADNHLRVQLAMALGNTLAHVDDPACLEDGERVVNELRVLAARDDASEALRTLVLDELSDRFAPRQ